MSQKLRKLKWKQFYDSDIFSQFPLYQICTKHTIRQHCDWRQFEVISLSSQQKNPTRRKIVKIIKEKTHFHSCILPPDIFCECWILLFSLSQFHLPKLAIADEWDSTECWWWILGAICYVKLFLECHSEESAGREMEMLDYVYDSNMS